MIRPDQGAKAALFTLKQLEAFYVSATLGSFTDASRRLVMTQSTIAKRIGELEAAVGAPLFLRLGKTLKLTEAGERLLPGAQEMMRLYERVSQTMAPGADVVGHIRIGATDLVGLTWLSALIQTIKEQFPKVQVLPEIDGGVRLYERLGRNELDIVIMPGPFAGPGFAMVPVGQISNAWMASPSFQLPEGRLTAQQISDLPVIGQPSNSALTLLYTNWFEENGFALKNVLLCNSLGMVAKLTVNGLGISYLPAKHFQPQIDAGELMVIDVTPTLPPVTYYAITRRDPSPLEKNILQIIDQVQTFQPIG
ncbi:LysR family transcriptional regulator [Paracoccus laeviglucosivorans]|uniref:DNA-binding transcriptional regulator, LysR family n=1 Tax=Paracoccus laeviglucosivorans TaxID=1197861 RepID=A0A521F2W3_9RHOB|nr:LysR family transcriptional regulator [Paracoccus laeviglucosivorans]SMO89840.1 DNA-binding transcriptional regulator, LysR family [Paracoccus laeviglucosivorans]